MVLSGIDIESCPYVLRGSQVLIRCGVVVYISSLGEDASEVDFDRVLLNPTDYLALERKLDEDMPFGGVC